MKRREKKKMVPAPPCECECVQCDIGRHCGRKHYASTFSALRFAKNLRRSVRRPNFFTPLFLHPFNKNGFKFFGGINALLNQQAVHGINRSSLLAAFKASSKLIFVPQSNFLGGQNNPRNAPAQSQLSFLYAPVR